MARKKADTTEINVKAVINEKSLCHVIDRIRDARVDDIRRTVCVNDETLIKHSDGNHYCIFHLPTKEKSKSDFDKHLKLRLMKIARENIEIEKSGLSEEEKIRRKIVYDFRYVWFPSKLDLTNYKFLAKADFSSATFSEMADFSSATFSDSVNFWSASFLRGAAFRSVKFSSDTSFWSALFVEETDFNKATFFADAIFYKSVFKNTINFYKVTFTIKTDFTEAIFEENAIFKTTLFEKTSRTYFHRVKFYKAIDLSYTDFGGYFSFQGEHNNRLFIGEKVLLNLQKTRIGDAKKISFHTIRLESSWFINTDATGFIFTDCHWKYIDGSRLSVNRELNNLKQRGIRNSNALLTKTCWQLADNHEESKSFPEASLFRQLANESKRLENNNGWKFWSLHWLYWRSSFYGESPLRAGLILAAILLFFSFAFMLTDFQVCPKEQTISVSLEADKTNSTCQTFAGACNCQKRGLKLDTGEAILHSLTTATFQNVEYRKPVSAWSEFWVILEKILVPLQAALLALAIRRKFMR